MTTRVLDKATAHFRNQISGEMKSILVPEWDTTIYFKSSSNLKEEGRVLELSQQGKTVEALVENLIIKARNADGTKMFSSMDKPVFMLEIDPKVIIRIVGEMNDVGGQDDLSVESVEKN